MPIRENTQAVVSGLCNICNDQSPPLSPLQLARWATDHVKMRADQMLKEKMVDYGHCFHGISDQYRENMGSVRCTCDWTSKTTRTPWLHETGMAHLREAEIEAEAEMFHKNE